ncbi:Methylated-DNA--protein-cysteine methyltransferase [Asaia bogorensis]|uniref:Methylated-DNA--protein-cysteine methyltransferase n=1 Tax=Asaia bogorensis TaxID=91915 RepID=A0A060QIM5_9PROT|nr:Methylated-DNA--protein-cysteine methyltransferase [Asaia bogorensis]
MPQLSLHSPIGPLTLSEDDGAIVALDWGWGRDQEKTPLLTRAQTMLERYFDGEPESFDLPLAPWGTAYRKAVWQALRATCLMVKPSAMLNLPSRQEARPGRLAALWRITPSLS